MTIIIMDPDNRSVSSLITILIKKFFYLHFLLDQSQNNQVEFFFLVFTYQNKIIIVLPLITIINLILLNGIGFCFDNIVGPIPYVGNFCCCCCWLRISLLLFFIDNFQEFQVNLIGFFKFHFIFLVKFIFVVFIFSLRRGDYYHCLCIEKKKLDESMAPSRRQLICW